MPEDRPLKKRRLDIFSPMRKSAAPKSKVVQVDNIQRGGIKILKIWGGIKKGWHKVLKKWGGIKGGGIRFFRGGIKEGGI